MLAFAMIETRQALVNLDAIMSVEGLDAIYIGPNDLALALGRKPKLDHDDPIVVQAIDNILACAKKHGIAAGIHNLTADYALKMIAKGFNFVTVGSDSRLMAAGAQQVVATMKARPAVKPASTY
ncbi:MAG TPA: aldolase/citrate lyase family protein, partial [Dongiaceae bacterium]|jgi:4-hydroxy-2-oxoheptanedioate aldolase|nr:aldolase/citrate lyase family protein [Dongiaceae bacterium]